MYYICVDPGSSASAESAAAASSLAHYCRNCGHREPVKHEICVSKVQLKNVTQNYGNIINKYTKLDPTLPRINHVKCPNAMCPSNPPEHASSGATESTKAIPREVIYIRYDEVNMKYVYLCAVCDALWSTLQTAAAV
jgi:DNA-directed RNA polymerase subunit M/transcription elongation factor TFIIS